MLSYGNGKVAWEIVPKVWVEFLIYAIRRLTWSPHCDGFEIKLGIWL